MCPAAPACLTVTVSRERKDAGSLKLAARKPNWHQPQENGDVFFYTCKSRQLERTLTDRRNYRLFAATATFFVAAEIKYTRRCLYSAPVERLLCSIGGLILAPCRNERCSIPAAVNAQYASFVIYILMILSLAEHLYWWLSSVSPSWQLV